MYVEHLRRLDCVASPSTLCKNTDEVKRRVYTRKALNDGYSQ